MGIANKYLHTSAYLIFDNLILLRKCVAKHEKCINGAGWCLLFSEKLYFKFISSYYIQCDHEMQN